MKVSQARNIKSFFTARTLAMMVCVGLFFIATQGISAQSVNLDQCKNGPAASPVQCTGGAWANGNAGTSNSHWAETQYIVYRAVITGATVGSPYSISIGYDILK